MKKYVTILLALALVLAMGAVSLAGTLYPETTKDWKVNVTINADGGIDVTYTVDSSDMAAVVWTEMAIYDHELDITGKEMTDEGMPYKTALGRSNNNTYVSERTINKGAIGEDSYPFEEGKTYSTTGEVDPGETGDFSAIAYAAAALAGCGALVIRKKK